MKVAALDLGSNTTLLLIAEVVDGTITKIFRDELTVTRLGQGVNQSRKFHPEALARMDECLGHYRKIIESEKVEKICAMATSAARDVTNGEELFALGKKHNIPIQVIPGGQEAEITFGGATYEYENAEGLAVIDVGGGSTEIIGNEGGEITGISVDVGSVRLTEMFITGHPVRPAELQSMRDYIAKKFAQARSKFPTKAREVLAVAGTPTTLSAVNQKKQYSSEVVHGSILTCKEMEYWLEVFASKNLEDRQNILGMDPKRADVIVAGLAILMAAAAELGVEQITVSDRGVRYGVALLAAEQA